MPQIKRMEMEARSFSADRARSLLVKVKEYKADLAALRTEFKKVPQPLAALNLPARHMSASQMPSAGGLSTKSMVFDCGSFAVDRAHGPPAACEL